MAGLGRPTPPPHAPWLGFPRRLPGGACPSPPCPRPFPAAARPSPASPCSTVLGVDSPGPVPWPRSRDMIWYNNVPHPKLVEYKKDQNWVTRSGDYLVFPGGGTQFKDGVGRYIQFIEQEENRCWSLTEY